MGDIEKIRSFIESDHPSSHAIIIGCKANNKINSYKCCEYDIIVVKNMLSDIKNKRIIEIKNLEDLTLEIYIFSEYEFSIKSDYNFWFNDYIDLSRDIFRNNKTNLFYRKKEEFIRHYKSHVKHNSIKNAINLTNLKFQLEKEKIDENFCNILLKMMTMSVLEIYIMGLLKDNPKPSHLKYQINTLRENNYNQRENVDTLLNFLNLERSNVSTLTRSISSLEFFRRKFTTDKLDLLLSKLNYFSKNSMYADGYLLINQFINSQNFNSYDIKNYRKIINYCIDVSNKEKITMLKEAEILFNINKSFINNNY